MLNKFKMSRENVMYLAIFVVAALAIWAWCQNSRAQPAAAGYRRRASAHRNKSRYESKDGEKAAMPETPAGIVGIDINTIDDMHAPSNLAGTNIDLQTSCAMNNGVGLASSLLPREAASQEKFDEMAPDDILKGQSFLNPREQIGYPETLGGSLRNANQQIRAEPPNPKKPYVWQNSTIPPDSMQRPICT